MVKIARDRDPRNFEEGAGRVDGDMQLCFGFGSLMHFGLPHSTENVEGPVVDRRAPTRDSLH
jgi:hypothetical protein